MGLISAIRGAFTGNVEKRSLWDISPYAASMSALTSLAGVGTTAGQPVNEGTAMSLVSVFAAVRNISDDIAKMQKGVFRLLPRGKVQILDHPMHKILCQSPNPEMTCFTFVRALMMSALTFGNGFAEIIRDQYTGKPIHAYPLYPMRVRMQREQSGFNAGKVYFLVDGSRRVEFGDMIHIMNLCGCTGLLGIPTIRSVKSSLGIAIALEEYAGSFFGNSAQPKGYFSTDGTLSPEAQEKFLRDWMKSYGGASSAHKNAFLQHGFKWNPMSANNNDSQFTESRAFQKIEIAALFRLPPHKIQDLTRGTMANVEQQNSEYVQDCLLSWTVQLEEELKSKLTVPHEVDIVPKFLPKSFFRGDVAARQAFYASGIQWGYLNRNDCREMEDLNPVDGLDEFMVPQNYSASSALETMPRSQLMLLSLHAKMNGVALDDDGIPILLQKKDDGADVADDQADPVDQVVPELNVAPPPGITLPGIQPVDDAYSFGFGFGSRGAKLVEAQTPLLADTLRRVLRTEGEKVSRAAKKDQSAVDEFYGKHPEYIRAAIGPVLSAVAGMVWAVSPTPATDEDRQRVDQFITAAVAKSISESRADLATEIELSGIETRTLKWTEGRPERVAGELVAGLLEVLTGKSNEQA